MDIILHKPVFINEIIGILKNKAKKDVIVDGTCGTGSHSMAILDNFSNEIKHLFCIDIDGEILQIAKKRIEEFIQGLNGNVPKVYFINDNYKNLRSFLVTYQSSLPFMADIVILDLGVSQYHLKTLERGFSFDSPYLDMRYNRNSGRTAEDLIKELSEEELSKIFIDYAGIKNPFKLTRILKKYVNEISGFNIHHQPSNVGLGHYLEKNLPKVRGKLHPATLIFQALRIYVNKELDNLQAFLQAIPNLLNKEALLFVITYHSIEDRVVKTYFKKYANTGEFSLYNKKVIKPDYKEISENKSIRSAKLRILYRNGNEEYRIQSKLGEENYS